MSDATCDASGGLSFGDALAELDLVVAALESGELELEDSLERYERAVSLVRALQAKLSDAQQKVTMLIGELESEPGDADARPGSAVAGETPTEAEVPF